jgi:hypothetical protein
MHKDIIRTLFLLPLHCRGGLNPPDNNLLCAYGRIQSAPTVKYGLLISSKEKPNVLKRIVVNNQ